MRGITVVTRATKHAEERHHEPAPLSTNSQLRSHPATQRSAKSALKRITDYFVAGSTHYTTSRSTVRRRFHASSTADIEVKALSPNLSHRLAPPPDAPPRMVRSLAFHDAIASRLRCWYFAALSVDDLIANVRVKSQAHMLAISKRAD